MQRRRRLPDLAECVEAVGSGTPLWEGQCYAVALAIRDKLRLDAKVRYGFYVGEIHHRSYFASRRNIGFCHHGWLELWDGWIFDPTRWTFEVKPPYLHVGENVGEYDIGGARWFADNLLGPKPKPVRGEKKTELLIFGDPASGFVRDLFDRKDTTLGHSQLWYLAHLPPEQLGNFALNIYTAIINAGQSAIIPIDQRRQVLGLDC